VSTNSTVNVVPSFDLDVSNLNKHSLRDIAPDAKYSYTDVVSALNNVHLFDSPAGATGFFPYTSDFIPICLNRLTATALDLDGIPFWLYKTCAAQMFPVIAKLINFSIQQSVVPISWKTACITPVHLSPATLTCDLSLSRQYYLDSLKNALSGLTSHLIGFRCILPPICLQTYWIYYMCIY
jgi:hypothetical protein